MNEQQFLALIETKDARIEALIHGILRLQQQYHLLAQAVSERHITKDWRDCNEETCVLARKYYDNHLGIRYWRYSLDSIRINDRSNEGTKSNPS